MTEAILDRHQLIYTTNDLEKSHSYLNALLKFQDSVILVLR